MLQAASFPSILLLIFASESFAQKPFISFEVATIKPASPESKGRFIRMQTANQFVARNHALKTLLAAAYNLSPKAISGGPAWVDSERFDILAQTPGNLRPNLEEQMAMLRRLLNERFKLELHRQERELPVFTLTVAKGGPKVKQSTIAVDERPEGPLPLIFVLSPEGVSLPARNATMGELASVMQRAALDRPVLDRTGLTGRYDFDLEWMSDETQFGGQGPRENPNSTLPSLFVALHKQLGLRLEATKGLVNAIVIDSAAMPSEN